jgi:hypothetical protein
MSFLTMTWEKLRLQPNVVVLLILLISMACLLNYGWFSELGVGMLTVALVAGLTVLPRARPGALSKLVIGWRSCCCR